MIPESFYVVKLAHNTIDTVRRRVQADTVGQRGRSVRPLSWIRQVLLHGAANHTQIS